MFAVGKYNSGSDEGGEPNSLTFHIALTIHETSFFKLLKMFCLLDILMSIFQCLYLLQLHLL